MHNENQQQNAPLCKVNSLVYTFPMWVTDFATGGIVQYESTAECPIQQRPSRTHVSAMVWENHSQGSRTQSTPQRVHRPEMMCFMCVFTVFTVCVRCVHRRLNTLETTRCCLKSILGDAPASIGLLHIGDCKTLTLKATVCVFQHGVTCTMRELLCL